MRNRNEPPAMVQALQDRNQAPPTAQRHRYVPFSAFLPGDNVPQDASAETVSMNTEPRSLTTTTGSPDTASQADKAECDVSSESYYENSPEVPPDAGFARHRNSMNAWLPMETQSGYFIFPDPLASGRRMSNTSKDSGPHDTTLSEAETSSSTNAVVMERRRSTRPDSVPSRTSAGPGSASHVGQEQKQFLPLLVDEPDNPKSSTLNPGLEKIDRRLRRAASHQEERHTQAGRTDMVPKIHPALRQAESHPVVNTEQLAVLRAEVEQLRADVQTFQRSAISENIRLGEFINRLGRNQDRLVAGWERTRNELFEIKVAQNQLQRRVNTRHDFGAHW